MSEDAEWNGYFGLSKEGLIALIIVSSLLVIIAFTTCALQIYRACTRKGRRKVRRSRSKRSTRSYTSFSSFDDDEPEFTPLKTRGSFINRTSTLDPIEEEELQRLSLGRLDLAARYYTHRDKLQIVIKEAQLGNVEASLLQNGFLYVTIALLPDRKNVFESALVPVSQIVDLDEICEFDIERPDVVGRSLLAIVCICDRYSKHRTLAEITYNLDRNEREDDVVNGEMSLEKLLCVEISRVEPTDNMSLRLDDILIGEILFSLCYMPTAGRLTLVVMKGRSLPLNDEKGKGIIVKTSIITGSKLLRSVQTSPVCKSRSPVYNEAFVFNVPFTKAKDTNIVLTVIHEKSKRMLGRVVVGPDSDTMIGRNHWRSAMAAPRRPIAQWHSLVQYL